MGSIGSRQSMSFEEAEEVWTMEFPSKSDPKYASMAKALNEAINNSPDYKGTVYRGLEIPNINSEQDILDRFKVGTVIPNNNGRDFISWSSTQDGASGFAFDGSDFKSGDYNRIGVMLQKDGGLKNSVELPGTQGSMDEVLAKSSSYTVQSISTEYDDGWGMKLYVIKVK